jgi:S-formylglutathione hydrolase FrmB
VNGRVAVLLAAFMMAAGTRADSAEPQLFQVTFQSKLLSYFFGTPQVIGASVLLPDSYYKRPDQRYPTVYVVPAFGGSDVISERTELAWQRPMRALGTEFIIVFLQGMVDINGEQVHQEFADSANDGPWGTALTSEFIPATDSHFRTIASGRARFLFGHSSGGWSVLWLQINYPELFNGAWAAAPDPVDFHDFLGPDLVTGQNFYRDSAGHPYGMCRVDGHDTTTLQRFVLQTQGCSARPQPARPGGKPWPERQFDTYDDVFSPRLSNGDAAPLFNRATGAIDPAVAEYWEEHYDITHLLQKHWSTSGPQLKGKLHVFVGAEDTFHLNGAVMLMHDALAKLGTDAEIDVAPGADHWQVLDWHGGLIKYALSEMVQRFTLTTGFLPGERSLGQDFAEKAVHQPFGLIEPSTILHVPLAVGELPGMKKVHFEHLCPLLGVVWYLNWAFEPLACAGAVSDSSRPASAGSRMAPCTNSTRVSL